MKIDIMIQNKTLIFSKEKNTDTWKVADGPVEEVVKSAASRSPGPLRHGAASVQSDSSKSLFTWLPFQHLLNLSRTESDALQSQASTAVPPHCLL